MIIEGKNAVEAAINAETLPEKVFIWRGSTDNHLIKKIKGCGVQYQFVERPALDRMSKQKNHQGFIAIVNEFKYSEVEQIVSEGYKNGKQPFVLILDGIEDPHNLGNIIRTAECMGVCGIIIPKNRAVGVTETVVRVSAGAVSTMKIARVTNINQEIQHLKDKGFWIFACELGGVNVSQTNLKGPIAIVMGGENTGVHQLTLKLSDGVVSIPMFGKTNSLNVGSAAAMVLYEANRQRSLK
jgi:23S rRNA (guanosine2251-2'-O)-methyltransferase